MNFPDEITAGLNFEASVDVSDYPAPAWTVKAFLRGPEAIDLVAAIDGTAHKFTKAAAETAEWSAGSYWVTIRAFKGADVKEVAKGQVKILADLAAVTEAYDGRTQNEIALDAINAVLAKRATQDQQKYTIEGRELWRTPIPDLIRLQSFYKAAVRREKNTASGRKTFGRAIHVRFK